MITKFQKRVYAEVKKIPKGKITTYKALAQKLKTSPRAVGQALKRNPRPIKTPCHRVIKSTGELGGYCGNQYSKIKLKQKLLKKEGVNFKNNFIIK